MIEGNVVPSTVTNTAAETGTRTSSTCHFRDSESLLVGEIEDRISESLGNRSEFSEPIQSQL